MQNEPAPVEQTPLQIALAKAKHWYDTSTPEEKEAMWELQRKSLVKSLRDNPERETAAAVTYGSLPHRLAHKAAGSVREADLLLALKWAMGVAFNLEPGDSRAVSDQFVAAAMVQVGDTNDECRAILITALQSQTKE